MLDCVSVENMHLSDALTIENYVPSLELMQRAAMGLRWHVLCGRTISIAQSLL